MRIYNPTYKKIAIDWSSVTLPVNEGTPFSADGTIANTSDAIGLLPVYIWKKPIDEEVYILIGGDVYQSEVEEAFGAELTDDAIASMGGINFYENDGTIDKASGGGGGGTGGGVFVVSFGEGSIDKSYNEISEAAEAGSVVFLKTVDTSTNASGDTATNTGLFTLTGYTASHDHYGADFYYVEFYAGPNGLSFASEDADAPMLED